MMVLLVTAATTVEGYSRGSFDFTNKAPYLFEQYNSDKSAGMTMAKRGRPPGATTRRRNPNNFAAHHAQTLMELWLAGAPVLEIRAMLSSLAGNPGHQALIRECWSQRGNVRRYTVPPKIKRRLCRLAIAHMVELQHDRILRQRAQGAHAALRRQGWTDTQITEILRRRSPANIDFETPDLDKVLEIVNRRAPMTTLRRKAASRKLRN
jgi:hypothetical protein